MDFLLRKTRRKRERWVGRKKEDSHCKCRGRTAKVEVVKRGTKGELMNRKKSSRDGMERKRRGKRLQRREDG